MTFKRSHLKVAADHRSSTLDTSISKLLGEGMIHQQTKTRCPHSVVPLKPPTPSAGTASSPRSLDLAVKGGRNTPAMCHATSMILVWSRKQVFTFGALAEEPNSTAQEIHQLRDIALGVADILHNTTAIAPGQTERARLTSSTTPHSSRPRKKSDTHLTLH